jgi:hypothetical protein
MRGIQPCAECGRPTRPWNSKKADYPDAIVRRGARCEKCKDDSAPDKTITPAAPATLAALETFLAGRRRREAAAARRNNPLGRLA